MAYTSTTIAWRGKLANLVAQVQQQKPTQGERTGTVRCFCGAPFHFTIESDGRSRGHCAAACGARWVQ